MKMLWCLVLVSLTVACSSPNKTFIVQGRSGEIREFSSLRFYTRGNLWDTGRGSIELSITSISSSDSKTLPRDFDGVQSVEILEGSGENISNLSSFEIAERKEKLLELLNDRDNLRYKQLEDEEEARLDENARENYKAAQEKSSSQENPPHKLTLDEFLSHPAPQSNSNSNREAPKAPPKLRATKYDNEIEEVQDSLKELKLRVTYTSGKIIEGIRKRNDWQHEDYLYGTEKDSDDSIRIDLSKVRSIKVTKNE